MKAIEHYMLVIDLEDSLENKEYTAKCITEIIKLKVDNKDFDKFEESVRKLLRAMNCMSKHEQRGTINSISGVLSKIGNIQQKKSVSMAALTDLDSGDFDQLLKREETVRFVGAYLPETY